MSSWTATARLLAGFARRRGLQGADCDDLVQDVLMALVKAMPGFRYDPHKGRLHRLPQDGVHACDPAPVREPP